MDLRYPIGKFEFPHAISPEDRARYIRDIAGAPALFRDAVRGLDDRQLDTPYRPEGWTVRQVIHHVADSHMNAYIRFKLALTEDEPTIKPYDQAKWAELADSRTMPVETSLAMIESLHARWSALVKDLTDAGFSRVFVHPERGKMTLDLTLAMYAWHGRHHAAHITGLRERMGWK